MNEFDSRLEMQWQACAAGIHATQRAHVDRGGILLVKGCEPTPRGLLALSAAFGQPMEKLQFKHKFGSDPIFRYAGNVSLKPALPKVERMDTNDREELTMHTARSYCSERPRYFALIMADAGWTDLPAGENGETILVRWERVFEEYARRHPESFGADIALLASEPVAYRPWYYPEGPIACEPVLRERADGRWAVRYWQHMAGFLPDSCASPELRRALLRLDEVANWRSIQDVFQMRAGDAYVISNELVAHGRCSFQGTRVQGDSLVYSSRQVYSFHVDPAAPAAIF